MAFVETGSTPAWLTGMYTLYGALTEQSGPQHFPIVFHLFCYILCRSQFSNSFSKDKDLEHIGLQ